MHQRARWPGWLSDRQCLLGALLPRAWYQPFVFVFVFVCASVFVLFLLLHLRLYQSMRAGSSTALSMALIICICISICICILINDRISLIIFTVNYFPCKLGFMRGSGHSIHAVYQPFSSAQCHYCSSFSVLHFVLYPLSPVLSMFVSELFLSVLFQSLSVIKSTKL